MTKIQFIESDRLDFEPISLKFLTKRYLGWLNDPEIYKDLKPGRDYSFKILEKYISKHSTNNSFFWAIVIKSSNIHIGNIKIDSIDNNKKIAKLGILIGDKTEWGKGYSCEAISKIEDYCLKKLKLNTLTIELKKSNTNAFNLYQNLGYKEYDRIPYPEKYNNISSELVIMYKNICNKKLILGTVQLGKEYGINNSSGLLNPAESQKILHTAYENNIRILDTAESYGKSHKIIANFHKNYPNKKFKVISKLNTSIEIKRNQLKQHLIKIINHLCIDSMYGYMIHDYNYFKSNNFLADEFELLKSNKLVNITGISLYNFNDIIDIVKNYNFDFIQIPFNILSDKNKSDQIFKISSDNGVKVFARSIFLQGLFFTPKSKIPNKLRSLEMYLNSLKIYSKKNNIELNELALNYVTKNIFIDGVLIGVDNLSQLKKNIKISASTHNIKKSFIDKIKVHDENLLNPLNW